MVYASSQLKRTNNYWGSAFKILLSKPCINPHPNAQTRDIEAFDKNVKVIPIADILKLDKNSIKLKLQYIQKQKK
jgi:hypothetical protein